MRPHVHARVLRAALFVSTLGASLGASAALANQQFGSAGRDGRYGADGRSGRSGQPVVVRADGTTGSFNVEGQDGYDGYRGEDGFSAMGCSQPTPTNDVFGAAGGDGGQGGNGGSGGDGGSVTAYFTDITALRQIHVRGAPGRGGSGAYGGRGAAGCRCQQSSWTVDVDGTPTTFHCTNGRNGYSGRTGGYGGNGGYGQVTLVSQLDPLPAEAPSVTVDISRMVTSSPVTLSKNHWENKTGGRALFAAGSDVSDRYRLFTGRTAFDYTFAWEASRPLTDFQGWTMVAQIEGADAKLYLPNAMWADVETVTDGTQRTVTFKNVVKTNELGNLQFRSLGGIGEEHVVAVKDNSGVSDVLSTAVHLKFYTRENGTYKKRFDADVPAEALTSDANGFEVAMGELGLDPAWLAKDTRAWVGLTMTRSLGSHSKAYVMETYYTIKWVPAVDAVVQATEDGNLYIGNQVVGSVKQGDQFKVVEVRDTWVSLKKLDDTPVRGWLQLAKLAAVPTL
jgi:hypothetical protein